MFVQYSFVARRARPVMQADPIRLSDAAIMALGVAFMSLTSLSYAITCGI